MQGNILKKALAAMLALTMVLTAVVPASAASRPEGASGAEAPATIEQTSPAEEKTSAQDASIPPTSADVDMPAEEQETPGDAEDPETQTDPAQQKTPAAGEQTPQEGDGLPGTSGGDQGTPDGQTAPDAQTPQDDDEPNTPDLQAPVDESQPADPAGDQPAPGEDPVPDADPAGSIMEIATDLEAVKAAIQSAVETYTDSKNIVKMSMGKDGQENAIVVQVATEGESLDFVTFVRTNAKLHSLFKQTGVSEVYFPDAPSSTLNPAATSKPTYQLAFPSDIQAAMRKAYDDEKLDDAKEPVSTFLGKFVRLQLRCPDASNSLDYTLYFIKAQNTVTWVSDTRNTTQQVAYGSPIAIPEDIKSQEVEGKTFVGWTKTYTDTTHVEAPGQKVTPKEIREELPAELAGETMGLFDVTYTAKWVTAENVTFHYQNEDWAQSSPHEEVIPQVVGENWKLPAKNPDGDGSHKFLGWFTEAGDSGTQITESERYSSGQGDIYAHWQTSGHTVDFYDGDQLLKHVVKETLTRDDSDIPSPSPKPGYQEPLTWYTEKTGGEEYTFPGGPLHEDLRLYARWTLTEYSITYDLGSEGVTNAGNPATYTVETPTFTLKDPKRTGYTFTGWSTTKDGKDRLRSPEIRQGSTGAKTYFAHWSPMSYKAHFDPGTVAGEEIQGKMIDQTLVFDRLTDKLYQNQFTCRGYTFIGWKVPGKENLFADGTAIGENLVADPAATPTVTLTAQWEPATYYVYLNLNPTNVGDPKPGELTDEKQYYPALTQEDLATGKYTSSDHVGHDKLPTAYRYEYTYQSQVELPTPVRTGYEFVGWYYGEEDEEIPVEDGDNLALKLPDMEWGDPELPRNTLKLTAHWIRLEDMPIEVVYHLQNVNGAGYESFTRTLNCGNVEQGIWLEKYKDSIKNHPEFSDKTHKDVTGEVMAAAKEVFLQEKNLEDWEKGFIFNPSARGTNLWNAYEAPLYLYFDRKTFTVSFTVDGEKTEKTYYYGQTATPPDISRYQDTDEAGYRNVYWQDDNDPKHQVPVDEMSSWTVEGDASYTLHYEEYYEASIGKTHYRTLQLALKAAEEATSAAVKIVTPHPDKDGNLPVSMEEAGGTLTVPAGVTLLIPCKANDPGYVMPEDADEDFKEEFAPGFNPDWVLGKGEWLEPEEKGPGTKARLYSEIKIPTGVTLSVEGTVLVNAVTGRPAAGHYDMDVTGGYGQIDLEGKILVKQGGILDVCGYIRGTGSIEAEPGGEVRDLYIVRNWRGGSFAEKATLDNDIYPMNEVDMHNIEVETVIRAGAKLVGTVKMFASDSYYYTRFPQIDNENGLIHLTSGTATKTYENGREKLMLNGSGSVEASALSVAGIAVSTGDYLYPVDGDTDFVLAGDWTIDERLKFMPGATVTVQEGSHITLAAETKRSPAPNALVFYDAFDNSSCEGTAYPAGRNPATLTLHAGGRITLPLSFAGKVQIATDATKANPAVLDLSGSASTRVDTQESGGWDSSGNTDGFYVDHLTFHASVGTSTGSLAWEKLPPGAAYTCYYEDGGRTLVIEGGKQTQIRALSSGELWNSSQTGTLEYAEITAAGSPGSWVTKPTRAGSYAVRQTLSSESAGNGEKIVVMLGTLKLVENPVVVDDTSSVHFTVGDENEAQDRTEAADTVQDAVLTEEDLEQVERGASVHIELHVDRLAASQVPARDEKELERTASRKDYEIYQRMNIELHKIIQPKGGAAQDIPIEHTAREILLRFDVPEKLRGQNLKFAILRAHDGEVEILPDRDADPDTITIGTDEFSTYAMVYQWQDDEDHEPIPPDDEPGGTTPGGGYPGGYPGGTTPGGTTPGGTTPGGNGGSSSNGSSSGSGGSGGAGGSGGTGGAGGAGGSGGAGGGASGGGSSGSGAGSNGAGGAGGGSGSGAYTETTETNGITITSDGHVDTSVSEDGTTLTITPQDGYVIDEVTVNGTSKGAADKLEGLKAGDKVTIKTLTTADAKIKAGVMVTTIRLRSSYTKKNYIRLDWTKSKGYKVDYYEVYRSVKRYSGYGKLGKGAYYRTPSGTKRYYINTKALKKGTTYYYKVYGVRVLSNGDKIYTKRSNKAWRAARRGK